MKLILSAVLMLLAFNINAQLEPQSLEQLVNDSPDGNQIGAEISVADDGSYIVIWRNPSGFDGGLTAKRYDSSHTAVGSQFTLIEENFEQVRAHFIGNEQYVIATRNSSGIVRFFILNSDNTTSATVLVETNVEYMDIDVQNSIMAITYSEDDQDGQVYLKRYSLTSNDWIGNAVLVSENQSNSYDFPHVRFHQDGSMVLAYIFYINTSGCCDYDRRVMRKTFTSNAIAEIPEQQVFSSDSEQFVLYGLSADVNNNDELLIVTASGTTSSSRRSRCWILDRDGNFIVNQDYLLNTGSSTTIYTYPQCAFYDNGDFVAAAGLEFGGFQNPNDAEAYVLYSKNYNEENSDWVQMNSTLSGGQTNEVVEILPNGGFIAAWDGNGFQGDTQGIYARAFNAVAFPGVRFTWNGNAEVAEDGSTLEVSVTLATPPTDQVTVNLSSDNINEATLGSSSLIFNSSNWDQPQPLTLTGIDDILDDGHIDFNILINTSSSTDVEYASLTDNSYTFTNLDDDATITPPQDQTVCSTELFVANILVNNNGNEILQVQASSDNEAVVLSSAISVTQTTANSWELSISEGSLLSTGTSIIQLNVLDDLFTYSSEFEITVNAVSVSAGEDQDVCTGNPVALIAANPNGGVLSWNGGIIDGQEFNPSIGENTYTVSTDVLGCIAQDQVVITVSEQPEIVFNAGEDFNLCFGELAILSAETDADVDSFSWSGGIENNEGFTIGTGEHIFVLIGQAFGCTYQDEITVTGLEALQSDFSAGPDQIICSGGLIILEAENTDGITFEWSNSISDGEPFNQEEGSTNYTATASIDGCPFNDEVTVEVLAPVEQPAIAFFGGELITNEADDYTWYYNGVLIPTLEGQSIEPIEEGNYQVSVEVGECESALSEMFIFTSIETELKGNDYSFYPNPAHDELHIDIANSEYTFLTLYNLEGKLLLNTELANGKNIIDITVLNSGVIVSVITDLNGNVLATEEHIKQ